MSLKNQNQSKKNDLYSRLRHSCRDDWHAYTHHEFIHQLAMGTLPTEAFKVYLVQDYIFLKHLARAYGLAAFKADSLEEVSIASQSLSSIIDIEIKLHEKYCASWGLSEDKLKIAKEESATVAYTRYVIDCGLAGDILDLYVALSPCVIGYGEIGARLLSNPKTDLKNNPYADWIEMYGGDAYQKVAYEGIKYLNKIGKQRCILERQSRLEYIFGQAVRLEIDFWEMGMAPKSH